MTYTPRTIWVSVSLKSVDPLLKKTPKSKRISDGIPARDMDIFSMRQSGATYGDIAKKMYISESRCKHIFYKMRMENENKK